MQFSNKKYILKSMKFLMFIFSVFTVLSCTVDETQEVFTLTNLVQEDNFDGNGLPDQNLWSLEIGTGQNGWGNNELQYYTDRTENVKVEDGMLHITALREDYEGSGYTSARMITKDKFSKSYGRYEARIKLPWGRGIWPAFWMLGSNIDEVRWPQCGEIDIMEFRGQEPTIIHGSVHGPGYSGGNAITKSYDLSSDRFDTGFHIFGIEWGPQYINFYVDDVLYNQITPEDVTGEWVYDDQPFFIILNLAVGGSFVGAPSEQTVFPQTMMVDYVRVYE